MRQIERHVASEKQKELDATLRAKYDEFEKELRERDEYIAQTRMLGKDLARFVVNGLIDLVDEQLSDKILLAGLASEDMSNRDTIIKELNSFDKDTDIVKLTKLVHLTEKLQLLSLLSMDSNSQLIAFLKNGDQATRKDSHLSMIRSIFGESGDSAKFMSNLVTYLAGKSSDVSGEDKKND